MWERKCSTDHCSRWLFTQEGWGTSLCCKCKVMTAAKFASDSHEGVKSVRERVRIAALGSWEQWSCWAPHSIFSKHWQLMYSRAFFFFLNLRWGDFNFIFIVPGKISEDVDNFKGQVSCNTLNSCQHKELSWRSFLKKLSYPPKTFVKWNIEDRCYSQRTTNHTSVFKSLRTTSSNFSPLNILCFIFLLNEADVRKEEWELIFLEFLK